MPLFREQFGIVACFGLNQRSHERNTEKVYSSVVYSFFFKVDVDEFEVRRIGKQKFGTRSSTDVACTTQVSSTLSFLANQLRLISLNARVLLLLAPTNRDREVVHGRL